MDTVQENTQISRPGETSRSPRTVDQRTVPSQSSITFREIHKNGWLKILPPADKKPPAGLKKSERVWIVFCVHDDVEAFLEIYPDIRLAGSHRPEKSFSLGGCRHVSPTICAQGDEGEFEFVITLPADNVRLIAPTWDMMMEWVETMQAKLREMKILSPKENIYTRMPESRIPAGPLAPTRDPNSPLPPRPNGPTATTAGLESLPTPSSAPIVTQDNQERENIFFPEESSRSDGVVLRNAATTSFYITQSEPPVYSRPHRPVSRPSSTSGAETMESTSVPTTPNVTIIEVSSSFRENAQPSPAIRLPVVSDNGGTVIFNFSQMENALPITREDMEARTNSPISLTASHYRRQLSSDRNSPQMITNSVQSTANAEIPGYATVIPSHARPPVLNSRTGGLRRRPSIPRSQFYDMPEGREDLREANSAEVPICTPRSTFYDLPEGSDDIPVERSSEVLSDETENTQEAERSLYERVYVPLSLPNPPLPSPHSQDLINVNSPRLRNIRETNEGPSALSAEGESQTTHAVSDLNSRNGQGTAANNGGNTTERRLQPPPQPYRQNASEANPNPGGSGVRLTLREQQVRQLRKEMSHPGGVRLQLRRKDCVGSIALVDALGSVWIAGWKQRERPMLYNVLHFGDQLLSVCGVRVQSAIDAQRLIRGASGLYVELLIRRLPYGRVFAVQRDASGDSGSVNSVEGLGLVLEGGTAEVRTIEPGGPAARAGLSPRATTADGLSICPWVLTEVNSRPLNPFFRDGEPATRLSAVGGEVSLLVQPSDLVRRLRKQLKAMRSYKDYIVQ